MEEKLNIQKGSRKKLPPLKKAPKEVIQKYFNDQKIKLRVSKSTLVADIKWTNRYSDTMRDDKHGRWARIASAGKGGYSFFRGKRSNWQIAWVEKQPLDSMLIAAQKKFNKVALTKQGYVFKISEEFPYNGERIFLTLKEAQAAVEKEFKWFISMCLK